MNTADFGGLLWIAN